MQKENGHKFRVCLQGDFKSQYNFLESGNTKAKLIHLRQISTKLYREN